MTAAKREDAQIVLHLCMVERQQALAVHLIVGEALGELSQLHFLQPLDHVLGGPGADVVRVETAIRTCIEEKGEREQQQLSEGEHVLELEMSCY